MYTATDLMSGARVLARHRVFPGGSGEYAVCLQVAIDDADALVMYIESNVQFSAARSGLHFNRRISCRMCNGARASLVGDSTRSCTLEGASVWS